MSRRSPMSDGTLPPWKKRDLYRAQGWAKSIDLELNHYPPNTGMEYRWFSVYDEHIIVLTDPVDNKFCRLFLYPDQAQFFIEGYAEGSGAKSRPDE